MDRDDDLSALRSELRQLRGRVQSLEAAIVRGVFVAASLPLIVGLLSPFIRYTVNHEERGTAIGWMGPQALSEVGESEGSALDSEAIVYVVIVSLPALVALAALVSLAAHGVARSAQSRAGIDGVLGTVLVFSIPGLGALSLMAAGAESVDDPLGPALWFYAVGAVAVAVLLGNGQVRRWWDAR